MNLILFILGIITNVVARHAPRSCQIFHTMQNFDVNKGLGTWYEIERYPNIFEIDEKCNVLNSTFVGKEIIVSTGTAMNAVSGGIMAWSGIGKSLNDDSFTLSTLELSKYAEISKYIIAILDTDYNNYQVRAACQKENEKKIQVNVWIESRQRSLDQKYWEHAHEVLYHNSLPTSILEKVDQTNCPDV